MCTRRTSRKSSWKRRCFSPLQHVSVWESSIKSEHGNHKFNPPWPSPVPPQAFVPLSGQIPSYTLATLFSCSGPLASHEGNVRFGQIFKTIRKHWKWKFIATVWLFRSYGLRPGVGMASTASGGGGVDSGVSWRENFGGKQVLCVIGKVCKKAQTPRNLTIWQLCFKLWSPNCHL